MGLLVVSPRALLFCALVAASLLVAQAGATLRGAHGEARRQLGQDEESLPVAVAAGPPIGRPGRRLPPAAAAPAPGAAAPGAAAAPPTGSANTTKVVPTVPNNRNSTNYQPPPPPPNVGNAGWPLRAGWSPPTNPGPLEGTQCEGITPKATMAADGSCPRVFRAFVGRTTEGAWTHQSNQQREDIMEQFCNTTCGQTYTATLTARRRGCTPPTPRGGGPAVVPDGPTAFPTNYPGLRLGCIVDKSDGQFCAVKMGAPQAGDCHFYKSCCYGELAAQAGGNGIDPVFFQAVDRICPGSAKYRNMLCV